MDDEGTMGLGDDMELAGEPIRIPEDAYRSIKKLKDENVATGIRPTAVKVNKPKEQGKPKAKKRQTTQESVVYGPVDQGQSET